MNSRSRDRRRPPSRSSIRTASRSIVRLGGGNTCATTAWGTVDRTFTKALTTGASLQALGDDKVFGHDNNFVIGASVDRSKIRFMANSELGVISPDLFVGPTVAVPGTGEIIHTAGNIGFSPVSCVADLLWCLLQRNV